MPAAATAVAVVTVLAAAVLEGSHQGLWGCEAAVQGGVV